MRLVGRRAVSETGFEVRVVEDLRAVVYARGELDMRVVEDFLAALSVAQDEAPEVVVDLSRVTFIDSTCFTAMV